MSCPHYRHTERTLGSVQQHICFDCSMVFDACEEHWPKPVVEVNEDFYNPFPGDPLERIVFLEPEPGDLIEGDDGEGI